MEFYDLVVGSPICRCIYKCYSVSSFPLLRSIQGIIYVVQIFHYLFSNLKFVDINFCQWRPSLIIFIYQSSIECVIRRYSSLSLSCWGFRTYTHTENGKAWTLIPCLYTNWILTLIIAASVLIAIFPPILKITAIFNLCFCLELITSFFKYLPKSLASIIKFSWNFLIFLMYNYNAIRLLSFTISISLSKEQ